jgi:hypothetical protein
MMPQYDRNKIVKTAILIVLTLTVLAPPFYRTVYESGPFRAADNAGTEYVDEAFDRALIAFALARATNAIISVVQDSEIDIAPAGVGVTIAIGEALDPVNDMIERFSWVMMVSLISLGIQKLLIDITPWFSVKFILLPALLTLLAGLWVGNDWARRCRYYGLRLLFLALLIRFCIPAVALANNQIYGLFLDPHYSAAVVGLEQGNVALRNMDPLAEAPGSKEADGFWAEVRKKAEQAGEAINLQHRVSRMKSRLSGMIENLLKMIAVFMLNTVILPIAFLWLLARLFRAVTGSESLHQLEKVLKLRMIGQNPEIESAGMVSESVHPARDSEQPEVDKKYKDIETD